MAFFVVHESTMKFFFHGIVMGVTFENLSISYDYGMYFMLYCLVAYMHDGLYFFECMASIIHNGTDSMHFKYRVSHPVSIYA